MAIKSLLLASAATLVAATGARAADAIVIPEPEPVEYVRVCDAYGAGYFYIPGTETCLKISGYVWYQIAAESYDGNDSPDFQTYGSYPADEGFIKGVRTRVEFDARSDTEWGTLRANIRLQADWGTPGDGPVGIDQGIIQLGGLRMGYTETVWNDSIGAGVASYGSHSWGGLSYGYQQRHQISYSFGSDQGFAATLSLEDDTLGGEGYMPDVVGAVSYNQSWGAIWAKVGYDEDRSAIDSLSDDGWGVTAGVHYNIPGFEGSSLRVIGYYSDSDNAYGVGSPALASALVAPVGGFGNSEWSVLGSYYHQFTPTFGASVGAQYFSDFYQGLTDDSTGLDGYEAELALVWVPIENFEVRSEVYYDKIETLDGTVSGFLRFTRFF
ncbi:porin [Aquibium oceanicum]|uniref:Porin n=1 Tax=Aquibium oceanicum TaxID=1670800 RepID=A0A1L3SQ78_9HYPH|nr:porin [Aquibium oceanicum]APH71566.1 hypothetical protein BSQ44_09420 [Aquibium oceanicum]